MADFSFAFFGVSRGTLYNMSMHTPHIRPTEKPIPHTNVYRQGSKTFFTYQIPMPCVTALKLSDSLPASHSTTAALRRISYSL